MSPKKLAPTGIGKGAGNGKCLVSGKVIDVKLDDIHAVVGMDGCY